jgi:hypothetical protein
MHAQASVPKKIEVVFCGRKSHPMQNVMAVVDFDLRFIFVWASWERTTHDVLIL